VRGLFIPEASGQELALDAPRPVAVLVDVVRFAVVRVELVSICTHGSAPLLGCTCYLTLALGETGKHLTVAATTRRVLGAPFSASPRLFSALLLPAGRQIDFPAKFLPSENRKLP
jgi:hypothetical protein